MDSEKICLHDRFAKKTWLLLIGDEPGQFVEAGIENDAHYSDDQDRKDDTRDVEIVPFDPTQVSDAQFPEQHFCRHDGHERTAERNAQSVHDGRRGTWKNNLEQPLEPREL